MALVKNLPEDSAFKIAARDHDWPLEAHLATGAWNEIKAMRSDLYALIAKAPHPYTPVLPPSAEREQKAKRSQIRDAHDDIIAQLRGQKRG